MKDLQTYAQECIAELNSINIPIGDNITFHVEHHEMGAWGLCKSLTQNDIPVKHDIYIADVLLLDSCDDVGLKETIIHELLHTTIGGQNSDHKGMWEVWAKVVRSKFPQYALNPSSTYREKGSSFTQTNIRVSLMLQYPFLRECPNCGKFYPSYINMFMPTKCDECGTDLKIIK